MLSDSALHLPREVLGVTTQGAGFLKMASSHGLYMGSGPKKGPEFRKLPIWISSTRASIVKTHSLTGLEKSTTTCIFVARVQPTHP